MHNELASKGRKVPDPIDTHVGARVRLRRTMLGLSQEKLGDSLGITFQQVQKYEKGTNRIGASRLKRISEVLKAPVSFFYDDMPGEDEPSAGMRERDNEYTVDLVSSTEGGQLHRAFLRIRDPKVRRRVVELVRSLAEDEDER